MGRNLVVIGGGNAGPLTSYEAKRVDPDLDITIIESGEHVAAST